MYTSRIDISRIVKASWESLKAHPAETIVGFLLFGVLGMAMLIPVLGLLVYFPLFGGLTMLYLKAARRQVPQIGDLFAGFKDLWKWVGVGLVFHGALLLASLPLIAAIVAAVIVCGSESSASSQLCAATIAVAVVCGIATLIMYAYLTMRWFFVYYAAADGAGVLESFGRSSELSKGIRLQLFVVFVLAALASSIASLMTMGLGGYFVGPIISLAYTHIYLERLNPVHIPYERAGES